MEMNEALEKVLKAYSGYYQIIRENVTEPFAAEALFDMHGEQYFLIKSAKITDIDSKEFVFFYTGEGLTVEKLDELDKIAWETGTSRVVPTSTHRNSDVVLVILTDSITPEVAKAIKKKRHYQSYSWGLKGWSGYKLIAVGLSDGGMTYNRLGDTLKKTFSNIFYSHKERKAK